MENARTLFYLRPRAGVPHIWTWKLVAASVGLGFVFKVTKVTGHRTVCLMIDAGDRAILLAKSTRLGALKPSTKS
jgi:hypothetical protein